MDKLLAFLTLGIEQIPFLSGYKTKIGVLILVFVQAYQALEPSFEALAPLPEQAVNGLNAIGGLFAGVGLRHAAKKNGNS